MMQLTAAWQSGSEHARRTSKTKVAGGLGTSEPPSDPTQGPVGLPKRVLSRSTEPEQQDSLVPELPSRGALRPEGMPVSQ